MIDANFSLLVAAGKSDIKGLNKFGRAPAGVQDVTTDIWSRADATPTQSVWLAPTATRTHAVVSDSASDACGAGTLTFSEQPANGNFVTIGTKKYTFQTTLTNVDGNVKISAVNTSGSIDNLIAAINLAAGAGTTYATSMTANAVDVIAFVGAGDTMTLYDKSSGTIPSTGTLSGTSAWGATTVPAGVGARSMRIYGLKTWDSEESYEDVYMYGVDTQNTVNSYVIIHRMKVLTSGATNPNVGTITATAATDSTVTALILPTIGQTLMAIYGVPSTKTLYLTDYHAHIMKSSGTTSHAEVRLLVNPFPGDQPTVFLQKDIIGAQSSGNGGATQYYSPMKAIPGPAIIKINCIASADDLDMSAGFNGYVA